MALDSTQEGNNLMRSDEDTVRNSEDGGVTVSDTPSIALLNRRLGIAPSPRMLTGFEIKLLQRSAKEVAQVAGEILASKPRKSKSR